jgi:hypothetical protein
MLQDSEASAQRLDELAQAGALGTFRYVHLARHGEVHPASADASSPGNGGVCCCLQGW